MKRECSTSPNFFRNYTHDNLVEIAGQNEETGFRATVGAEVGGSNPPISLFTRNCREGKKYLFEVIPLKECRKSQEKCIDRVEAGYDIIPSLHA